MLVNYSIILIWGFAASIILLTTTIAGQSLGLTRIDIPFIVGTMFTSNRDRARVVGVAMHIVNGWVFALVYGLFFESTELASWWFGALIGAVQGIFVVVVLLPILPGLHPRMVSDYRGPEPTRLLEPPGFLATNYGRWTPVVTIVAHTLYGMVLGMFYMPR
ncbi:MAG TPA: hypothetical protein VJ276_17610 [Thermoanaerobaculia bacterium]|nr:hypothetical protein [Thermoanaerobaculia bacterium]